MSSIPRSILVFFVLVVGVLAIYLFEKPHTVCDSQFVIFRESLVGRVFPAPSKSGGFRPPIFNRTFENCKIGQTGGACYELFDVIGLFIKNLKNIQNECGPELENIPEIETVLKRSIALFAKLAWGDSPPGKGRERLGWLESSDLALFCSLRDQWYRLLGQETFDIFRQNVSGELPGEALIVKDGTCVNCTSRKKAKEVLAYDELWSRSLFSIRCDLYR